MRLLAAVVVGLLADIRETLPGNEQEAGVFLAGMTWAFLIFWACLIAVTFWWFKTTGATP